MMGDKILIPQISQDCGLTPEMVMEELGCSRDSLHVEGVDDIPREPTEGNKNNE